MSQHKKTDNDHSRKYESFFLTKRIVWCVVISLLLLISVWFQLPSYAPCSNFSAFGSYEQNGLCIIAGDLVVKGNVASLPQKLHVKGNVEIIGTSISDLPATLRTDGDLYLYKTSIGSIPEDTYIGGDFHYYLSFGSPNIYCDEIPPTVVIKGNTGCEP
ncbi:MAG: hypothetical protein V7784_10875 [Oceanospirillaceae bacterium]